MISHGWLGNGALTEHDRIFNDYIRMKSCGCNRFVEVLLQSLLLNTKRVIEASKREDHK